MLATFTG